MQGLRGIEAYLESHHPQWQRDHIRRVRRYTFHAMLDKGATLSDAQDASVLAHFHDIGKLHPEWEPFRLLRSLPYTTQEQKLLSTKIHVEKAHEVLDGSDFLPRTELGPFERLRDQIRQVARQHHDRYALYKNKGCSFETWLIQAVDCFDALTSDPEAERGYRPQQYRPDEAIIVLRTEVALGQFSSEALESLLATLESFGVV